MGRMLGSHADNNELDRPDLNKCPDCGCFFAQDHCPLCGKVCPEEMRAGNRKKVKHKRSHSNSGRVTFVEWYHSWIAIILAMLFFPILGIVLLVTSPHKRSLKIGFVALAVAYAIISSIGFGSIIGSVTEIFDKPVNDKLSREEYISSCETVDAERFYRSPTQFKDAYVSLDLTVVTQITEYNGRTYYICHAQTNDRFEVIVRDCLVEGSENLIAGDRITVYGEGDDRLTLYDANYAEHTAPSINMAYVEVWDTHG